MIEVQFKEWTIEVDMKATAEAYRRLSTGEAATCGCGDCVNWVQNREKALPERLKYFLKSLGVDAQKETEISDFANDVVVPGRRSYTGEYLFIGCLKNGPDCFVETHDKTGARYELMALEEGASVGVSSNIRWALRSPRVKHLFPTEVSSVVMFSVLVPRSMGS